ncbi:MAG TPA: DUF2844 domain-containing protein [Ramlibacter sp.]|jgi:hypothetical protein|uniref:DUF2844 domain-containing protein n=1 Tax=Ramlibacter sp. TaxID=1917967 RepID=UPI002D4B5246|nr:DUF2844 domain-containing protein [Ramlibacter sp.]HZY19356.1 DUF2844 domain-containing protein [Ramlibacter sp.]
MKTLLATALLACAGSAGASLGSRLEASAPDTRAALTQEHPATGADYLHQQHELDTGTTVHEFADLHGTVFAVTWSGPFLPDLRALLGPSFSALTQAQDGSRGRTSALSISRPDLVVMSAGRMGAFQGRAWLPAQLPVGFDPRTLP